ncbi:hypothetical protein LEP1GSC108_2446 [Leptospira weilii str. UI 13098]|uniref:Uncharacterized protein n=1 Tax=Leptospira weilii str. UI 13098 TaxID=1088542 RepID=M6Q8B2_9LEPT|nr:hypothetical protein LEP1GSC108_2446 [Leptospira weilii str. UI 13098]
MTLDEISCKFLDLRKIAYNRILCQSDFEKFIHSIIPKQIPKVYLEGYSELIQMIKRLPWPSSPQLIWTSNAHNSDEVFKTWAAEKIEKGSKLVIGQHGGNYGIAKWSFNEDHDVEISDRYLSWGWDDLSKNRSQNSLYFESVIL